MLHVTNGDCAAERIRAATVEGEVLPWRDVLHEGPVPAGLGLKELSRLRAQFLAGPSGSSVEEIRNSFDERDRAIAASATHDEIVLWFEHDLYDQLQLIQLLDLLPSFARGRPVRMICIDRFLGELDAAQIASFLPSRAPVTVEQLRLARRAWAAFRAPEPVALAELLEEETGALPFLRAAFRRQLQQLPSTRNGLGRTEQQIVDALLDGARSMSELFRIDQRAETAPFLGDTVYFGYVHRLAAGERPLVAIDGATASLTDDGRAVSEGAEDAIALNGIDRWWGGLHQQGRRIRWRWDREHGLVG